eukprot:TRINITY_DN52334_c0_g1_i1.p2 TRINITY_DN52334_c0_g1~~TRINITY_DN52334_c0_g1_i1.p2  ORF type:complete len:133 (+),score=23.17 TRINITY_DN52334_c0_g1_i1:173-571(+)
MCIRDSINAEYMGELEAKLKDVSRGALAAIDKDFNVSLEENNPEVSYLFFTISVLKGYRDHDAQIDKFLGDIGRLRYIYPIYKAYSRMDPKTGAKFYRKHRGKYHPMAQASIDKLFKDIYQRCIFMLSLIHI